MIKNNDREMFVMKKILLSFIVLFSVLIISGFVKEDIGASYSFRSSDDQQLIKQNNDVYKNSDDFVYYELANDQTETKEKSKYTIELIVLIIAAIILSFFVFKPSNIRKAKIIRNAFIPMHEEPYEPTDLNVAISYSTILFIFIVVIFSIITILY